MKRDCNNGTQPVQRYHGGEPQSYGCMPRGMQMHHILEIRRDQWKKENGYGMRWKVECSFSDFKRILADTLRAKTLLNCVREVLDMVFAYNLYKVIRVQTRRA